MANPVLYSLIIHLITFQHPSSSPSNFIDMKLSNLSLLVAVVTTGCAALPPPISKESHLTNPPVPIIARTPDSPIIYAPTGDTLNRTACFCASRTWPVDQTFGYYYSLSYYNAHLNHTYLLEPACQSRISVEVPDNYNPKDKPVLQNQCLQSRFHNPEKHCTGKDGDSNTFCYTFAGGANYDSWAFGSQHRTGLPLEPQVNYSNDVVEEVCERSCNEHNGGMEMLKGDAFDVLSPYYEVVGERLDSSVVFYPLLDDMCKDCK